MDFKVKYSLKLSNYILVPFYNLTIFNPAYNRLINKIMFHPIMLPNTNAIYLYWPIKWLNTNVNTNEWIKIFVLTNQTTQFSWTDQSHGWSQPRMCHTNIIHIGMPWSMNITISVAIAIAVVVMVVRRVDLTSFLFRRATWFAVPRLWLVGFIQTLVFSCMMISVCSAFITLKTIE